MHSIALFESVGKLVVLSSDRCVLFCTGVLDGLLEHDNMDLTGIHAISKMSVPLDNVLGSYDDRAEAAKKTPMQMVMLEAAVQGW